ncbi:MAG TPA: haloacid dehalogenase type II [Anaeromyxobacter sp.]|nr:haloacid dehalogenase type II [Anaeromyxobacter sp.]
MRSPIADRIRALLFDTYGTVVDWRGSILDELAALSRRKGLSLDRERFLAEWKSCYRPEMDRVNLGEAPFVTVDVIYRRRLVELLAAHGVEGLGADEVDELARAWWRLRPWPEVAPGLARLKRRYVLAPLSNGSFAGMVHLARFAGLPWDCILSAELARCYKPRPEVYRTALALLALEPGEVMMVAAHNYDLAAARALGLRTAFVARPAEYGPGQETDLGPEGAWDVVARGMDELADALEA